MEHQAFANFAQEILKLVSYKDWKFEVDGGILGLRVVCVLTDAKTREPYFCHGRWWRLTRHMTRSEIVQTAFKAVITAEEHEIRESFRYRNEAIFGPHFDVEALVELSTNGHLDVRP